MNKFLRLLTIFALPFIVAIFTTFVYAGTPAPPPPQGMVDLMLHKSYATTPLVSIQYSFASGETQYQTPGGLTDGQIASSLSFTDPEWQGYLRGGARSVVVDMGEVNTVHQMQERFLHLPTAGIYFPGAVSFYLSTNDTAWAYVGTVNTSIPLTSTTPATQTYTLSGLDYQARYAKMTFTVDVFVFADEFQAFGDTGIVSGSTVPAMTSPIVYPSEYLAPGSPQVGGIENMVLIPNGYYAANPAIEKNSTNQLIPYVGYRSSSGAITDFMFDAVLFTPYGAAPSGGNYGANPKTPTVKSDWQYFLNNTFEPDYNLAALDSATSIVKDVLGDLSYKEKVEIAIPYPNPTSTNFGDINGTQENLSYLASREQVLKWYVDQVIAKWDSASYSNLDLVGFYWYSEEAAYTVDDSESAMINYIANYITGLGEVLDWIPFKDASGFAEWSTLGFNGTWMQPNYAFDNFPEQELGETADACKKLGMGIEIEIHWNAPTSDSLRQKYYAYLKWGVAKGYMTGATHAYYQNSGPGTFYTCAMSTDSTLRKIYDATYQFIKGTYSDRPSAIVSQQKLPDSYALYQNYPNPFNPSTTIGFKVQSSAFVSLKVYDVLGRKVTTLVKKEEQPGSYEVRFDASGLPSGVYFYRLNAGAYTMTKKMAVVK